MSCGCGKGKKHIHKKPGDGRLYTDMADAFWETLMSYIGHRNCNCPCHAVGPDNEMYEPGECCFFCGCMPRLPTAE